MANCTGHYWNILKDEILSYLKDIGQDWCEDRTNAETDYLRNHIRHHVLPSLDTIHPNPTQQLQQRLADYRAQQSYLHDKLLSDLHFLTNSEDNDFKFNQIKQKQHRHLLLTKWLQVNCRADYKAVAQAEQLIHAQKGKYVDIGSYRIVREADSLRILSLDQTNAWATPTIREGELPVSLQLPASHEEITLSLSQNVTLDFDSEYTDHESITWPLTLRPWQSGDRVQLLGMNGTQKVSDILTNLGIAAAHKQHAMVLCDAAGIIWVQHARIAERVKITDATQRSLKISLSDLPQ